MTPCTQYREELAASAGLSEPLSSPTAAHLATCENCRAALAALQTTAATHSENSDHLPEPKLQPQFESWFAQATAPRSTGRPTGQKRLYLLLRPAFIGAAVLLVLAVAIFSSRRSRDAAPSPSPQPTSVASESISPSGQSWQALRDQLERGELGQIPSYRSSSMVSHYRLKDAYFQSKQLN